MRDDRGDRDDRERPVRTLLYPGDRDDRVKFTCDHMETVNRPDRQHTISSDRGHWGDRGDYMETRLKGEFPLSRNFYVRTDVNFNWLYVRKLK